MEGWSTVELGESRDDGSPIEAITQNLPGDDAMNHHASESNKEAVIQPNTNLDGDKDHFFSRILQSTSNLIRAEKEDHAKQVTAVALSSKMCPICLEDYKNSDQVCHSKSQCGHIYHVACLMNWMIQNDDCPICRAVFLRPFLIVTLTVVKTLLLKQNSRIFFQLLIHKQFQRGKKLILNKAVFQTSATSDYLRVLASCKQDTSPSNHSIYNGVISYYFVLVLVLPVVCKLSIIKIVRIPVSKIKFGQNCKSTDIRRFRVRIPGGSWIPVKRPVGPTVVRRLTTEFSFYHIADIVGRCWKKNPDI